MAHAPYCLTNHPMTLTHMEQDLAALTRECIEKHGYEPEAARCQAALEVAEAIAPCTCEGDR